MNSAIVKREKGEIKMLSKHEKRTVKYLCEKGRSYQEIAQDLIMLRNHSAFNRMCADVEAHIKEMEQ